MKHIHTFQSFINESVNKIKVGDLVERVSTDAFYIHQITGSGADAAQNFIDDNNIDSKKLADYVKQNRNTAEKYNVRDIIAGRGVGANKGFRKRFIKQFLNEDHSESFIGEREYSETERKDLADKGQALPDGSFPIKDIEDLKNAIQAYGRAKDQAKAAKFIAKRAKELGAEDLIPDTEDFQKSLKESYDEQSKWEDKAQKLSKKEGITVHVNSLGGNRYELSDWYDSDSTVASYENGRKL